MLVDLYGLLASVGSAWAQEYAPDNSYGRYFSIGHPQFLRTRLDPIVSPGKLSGHVHTVAGTSNFLASQSFGDSQDGECTTSFIQADKSSYWAPQLYYKWENGTYSAISGDGLVTYWKYASDVKNPEFAVVPDDFRMLAGDVSRDHYDPKDPSHAAISFQCIGDGYDYKLPYIPSDLECKWIRPQAFFPNCWNGIDSYLPDNSHVRYPIGDYESGACPAGFVRIPSLFLETYYKMPESLGSEYKWYPGCLVLANGDVNGFSFHSDWLNGWPSGMLVDAYKQCHNQLPGTVDGCSVFEPSRDNAKAQSCRSTGEVVTEPVGVETPLAQLPGNNPEFNSSRDSPDYPKRLFTDYVETAEIVKVDASGSGSCNNVKCSDYSA